MCRGGRLGGLCLRRKFAQFEFDPGQGVSLLAGGVFAIRGMINGQRRKIRAGKRCFGVEPGDQLRDQCRLQRVAALLADGRAYTTLDIVQGAGVCAVNSAIAELRWNGYSIECTRNGDVWVYRLISAPELKTEAAA